MTSLWSVLLEIGMLSLVESAVLFGKDFMTYRNTMNRLRIV